jgi:hypothetical protein
MTAAADLLSALDMVAFLRRPDGSFEATGRAPAWFQSLSRDLTFPFLGTFLETATGFWSEGRDGVVWSGPCEQVDDTGRPFHFEVVALRTGADQYLVFERRHEMEEMQQVLQKARELTLEHDRVSARLDNLRATQAGALASLAGLAQELAEASAVLRATSLSAEQQPLVDRLQAGSATLTSGIDTMLRVLGRRS